jgi:hypothetical protein
MVLLASARNRTGTGETVGIVVFIVVVSIIIGFSIARRR